MGLSEKPQSREVNFSLEFQQTLCEVILYSIVQKS